MKSTPTPLTLLAPAKNRRTGYLAMLNGADAVYIGGPHHGARSNAANSIEDIAGLCQDLHPFGVKVYVTLNTIVYESELGQVEKTIRDLYAAGVDALIIQDLGILRLDIPPIALHASTQCDANTPGRVKFLADLGFNCVVVPREFSLDEIRAVRRVTDVPLEGFVHGALCVSYSGDCRASWVNGRRSANRGECAQICRLPYDLTDIHGHILVKNQHLLSLKDLNRILRLQDMAEAGISIFKIEGRLKEPGYVETVVRAYSQALNRLCEDNPEKWCRSSYGVSVSEDKPALEKVFNRGFTEYFLDGNSPLVKPSVLRPSTPKFVGEKIGNVELSKGNRLKLNTTVKLNNGDGLGYFAENGEYTGFRINRVDGATIYLRTPLDIKAGTPIYRNFDITYGFRTRGRVMLLDAVLEYRPDTLSLTLSDESGINVTAVTNCNAELARTSQSDNHLKCIAKLGGTNYKLHTLDDKARELFIPSSVLTDLRRQAVDLLLKAKEATYKYEYRRPESIETQWPEAKVDMHQNVANSKASDVYGTHGGKVAQRAIEVSDSGEGEVLVMTTRHCLRGYLGACLKSNNAGKLPETLYLKNRSILPMRLEFDCANCRMKIYAIRSDK